MMRLRTAEYADAYPSLMKVLFGVSAIVIALLGYLSFSPLRAKASHIMTSMVQEEDIGAPGWQPNARTFLFGVPFYRQERALSCEIASLRSALAGVGVNVAEWDLWLGLSKDYTRRYWTETGLVWGDPQKGFVGNINGRMPETGYGVFIDPIEALARDYASTTRVRLDHPEEIDAALSQGHPIIIWSAIGQSPSVTFWRTEDGKEIAAPLYEHTLVIVGYRGRADHIEGLYLIDPLTSMEYQTWDEFRERVSYFGRMNGLAISPK